MKKLSYLFGLLIAASLIFTSCNNEVLVTDVTLSESAIELIVGETATLRATVTPDDADDQSVTWASSNTTAATVNASGVVTAVSAGTATITVTTVCGGRTATATVTVSAIDATGITLNRTSIGIGIGATGTLTATVEPANATNQNVTWTSNNTTVATVANGIVTAVSEGRATITATTVDGSHTATALVDVFTHEQVTDAGVEINGIRWATRNVSIPGSFVDNPATPGMLFQWNRPIGWTPGGNLINHEGGTTWNPIFPTGTSWYSQNDPCPEGWRVPTRVELESLMAAGSTWTTNWNGTSARGRIFGTAPNQIFLPVVGNRSPTADGGFERSGTGIYWSSTQSSNARQLGWTLDFTDNHIRVENWLVFSITASGNSVRCVAR